MHAREIPIWLHKECRFFHPEKECDLYNMPHVRASLGEFPSHLPQWRKFLPRKAWILQFQNDGVLPNVPAPGDVSYTHLIIGTKVEVN